MKKHMHEIYIEWLFVHSKLLKKNQMEVYFRWCIGISSILFLSIYRNQYIDIIDTLNDISMTALTEVLTL